MNKETLELVDKLLDEGLEFMETAYPIKETNPLKLIEGTGFLIALYRLFTPSDEELKHRVEIMIELRRLKGGLLLARESEVNK